MRLVHFADSHLGFRQFDRDVKGGYSGAMAAGSVVTKNQREADVEQTFHTLIDDVIVVRPDVIVVAGDVFHTFRPSNATILNAVNEFARLAESLPETVIVVAAGNHDLPRTRETACILNLLTPLGIRLADWEATRFDIPALDLSVLAVPDALGMARPTLEPNPAMKFNVLVCHGEAREVRQQGGVHSRNSDTSIAAGELQESGWSYSAFGHFHQYEQVGPTAYYSGSIDLTSSNPWGELKTPKGFIEHDLVSGEHIFHKLPASRDYLDVSVSADGLSAAELTEAIREVLDDAWVDGAVVRCTLNDCERTAFREVDRKMLREYRARALNCQFDVRVPETVRVGGEGGIAMRSHRLLTIPEMLDAVLRGRVEQGLTGELSYEQLHSLAEKYLGDADEILNRAPASAKIVVEEMAPVEVAV